MEGDRQQHGDRGDRPDPRQHADQGADQHADEAIEQVDRRQGDLEAEHEVGGKVHQNTCAQETGGQAGIGRPSACTNKAVEKAARATAMTTTSRLRDSGVASAATATARRVVTNRPSLWMPTAKTRSEPSTTPS